MKKNLTNTIAILISLLPVIYLAFVYSSLPEIVPVHFDEEMKPDRMGNKSELWLVTGIMVAVSIFVYFLLKNLHRIDPKRKDKGPSAIFPRLAFGLVVFMAALNVLIILSAKGAVNIQNMLFPLLGLMFAFIGNNMVSIKPNYFAGLRLPWTLSSDDNWRKTHQLGGRLWFAGGLLIAIVSVFLPAKTAVAFFIGTMAVMVLVPVIYSYLYFKKHA